MRFEQIMSNEVLDIRDGTHESPKYKDNGYPLITSKNLKHGRIDFSDVNFISEEDYISINKRSKVNKGDVLYSMIGSIGNYAFVDNEPNYAIKNVALFRSIDKRLHNKFFLHLINSSIFQRQIEQRMKGGTQKFVSLKILRNLKIPLPPLEEQKKIAAILDAADDYRQKTKALIEKYDQLTQSLFQDMFGDPVTNPMGWETISLTEFIKSLKTGVSVNSTNKEYKEGDFGILKTSCVYSGIFRPSEAKVIREDEYERMKLSPKADSIIISRMNTTELVGKSAYIRNHHKNLFLPDRLWQTEKAELSYNVRWLSHALSFQSFMNEIGKISSGTSGSMKNISKKNFLKLPMIYPPEKLQSQFTQRVAQIEKQKQQAEESLVKAEELFSSLLQRAFKGELTS